MDNPVEIPCPICGGSTEVEYASTRTSIECTGGDGCHALTVMLSDQWPRNKTMENTQDINAASGSLDRLVRAPGASVANTLLEPLAQLLTVTWDGNLMSKDARDRLVKCGLVERAHGYNWLTNKGIQYLVDLGALVP